MKNSILTVAAGSIAASAVAIPSYGNNGSAISIPATVSTSTHRPLSQMLSYSIEFSSFPDFAGNLTNPNNYSYNLLKNLEAYSGAKPLVRVGGNTQDLTTFYPNQTLASIPTTDPENPDYPASLTIGPAFFESYLTWPGVRHSHGFNLADNTTEGREAMLGSVPYACAALRGHLNGWEMGNEPDLFRSLVHQPPLRPADWHEAEYVAEWQHWSRKIRDVMEMSCPDMIDFRGFEFFAPSLAGAPGLSTLEAPKVFAEGLNQNHDIGYIAAHKYIASRRDPGITFQGTLLNHTANIAAVDSLITIEKEIRALNSSVAPAPAVPFILGEGNSLAQQGIGGVSNAFGAALWGLDYGLQLVSQGIGRWHMHQGTNYRYQAWQPVETSNTTKGTKAPYYGNVALTAFLGDLTLPQDRPQVVDLSSSLGGSAQSAYAGYVRGRLEKVVVINMAEWNTTEGNVGVVSGAVRPMETYDLTVPEDFAGKSVSLQRLLANGSDAITGITFDGYSYALELDEGKPVCLDNVTRGEHLQVGAGGLMTVQLPRSSAVILDFGAASANRTM